MSLDHHEYEVQYWCDKLVRAEKELQDDVSRGGGSAATMQGDLSVR